MKWKVITAKKRDTEGAPTTEKGKKESGNKHHNNNEISQAEQAKRDEVNRHANVDVIWNDVTILSEKLS